MIYIKEVLPNPVGRDTEGEWIKLINKGNESVNLNGWYIKDESGKTFNLVGKKINPFSEIILGSAETKISLNNTSDLVVLYNSDGKVMDKLVYEEVNEGEIIIAKVFQEEKSDKSQVAITPQILKNTPININYEWWPLFLGITLSIVMGVVGGLVFKKINTPS